LSSFAASPPRTPPSRRRKEFVTKLGKTIAVAEDFPAFIVKPHPAADDQRGDLHALRRRLATSRGFDTAMRLGAHHPMGPLELADFIASTPACR